MPNLGWRAAIGRAVTTLGTVLYPHPDFLCPPPPPRPRPPLPGHPELLGTRPNRAERAVLRALSG
ncbi:hypothetical protein [Actinokineospora globicatena]|uniref:Uncharacterized protein n=1 Tax=Actinokineospora globicatena TaxID=103729 RepID=A0A9W6V7V0_9PSEU|nr:hypothetical protein [Actinokineospora globicatena]MCP2306186.1 hypothetical protein [Actinokineospora globicatena]GLW79936.1 hypothetical protein Aglo01_44170 [Actinokineospora globicatena]GLW86765.1 hypothetical protein Aglo02_44040 [Actinokineospora globicatena]GLW93185.1 hypothetical protein Aglo03_40010 [Actinokineospora globicatena]